MEAFIYPGQNKARRVHFGEEVNKLLSVFHENPEMIVVLKDTLSRWRVCKTNSRSTRAAHANRFVHLSNGLLPVPFDYEPRKMICMAIKICREGRYAADAYNKWFWLSVQAATWSD